MSKYRARHLTLIQLLRVYGESPLPGFSEDIIKCQGQIDLLLFPSSGEKFRLCQTTGQVKIVKQEELQSTTTPSSGVSTTFASQEHEMSMKNGYPSWAWVVVDVVDSNETFAEKN